MSLCDLKDTLKKYYEQIVFLAGLALCWALIWITWPGRIDTPDSWARYDLSLAIVEQHSLEVTRTTVPADDPTFFSRGPDGRLYCSYPILHSLLMLPTVWLFKDARAAAMVNPLLFPIFFFLLFSLFRRQAKAQLWPAIITTMLITCSTMVWPYARLTHDVFMQMVFFLLAVWLLLYRNKYDFWPPLLAGLAFSANFNLQLTCLLMLPVLVFLVPQIEPTEFELKIYVRQFLKPRTLIRLVLFFVGMLPMAALWFAYNYYRFDNIWGSVPKWLGNGMLSRSIWIGVPGFLVSPFKSVFLFNLPIIFALLLWPRFFKRSPALAISGLSLFVIYILGFGKLVHWGGDWAWGPRYLLPAIPLLALPLVELAEVDWRKKYPRLLPGILIASLIINIAAVSTDPNRFYRDRDYLPPGFPSSPESTPIYFSLDYVPIVDSLLVFPVLVARTIDGLFNNFEKTQRDFQLLQQQFQQAQTLEEKQKLFHRLQRLQAPENLRIDYWWLDNFIIPNSPNRISTLVNLFLLFSVLGLSGWTLIIFWRRREKLTGESDVPPKNC